VLLPDTIPHRARKVAQKRSSLAAASPGYHPAPRAESGAAADKPCCGGAYFLPVPSSEIAGAGIGLSSP